MSGRAYLSIGDVLTLLRQEFPDVTISKIRFLESQGLVNPERTPSGYRKFYEQDVERLRWVLRQQREHFLPLKVIKGRLEQVGDTQDNGHLLEEGEAIEGFEEAEVAPYEPVTTATTKISSPAADARGVVASSHAQATPTPTGPALPGFEAQRAGRTRSEAAGPKIAGRAALDAAV
ncbi:MAG: MerR family transcriptional regulator, partial [Acidimicrobiales bacterium]